MALFVPPTAVDWTVPNSNPLGAVPVCRGRPLVFSQGRA
jgi:hypothetical protein